MVHTNDSPWRRYLVSASLIGEIIFLVLFLVGPAGASIDSDADGIPDIPIVVTATTPLAEISQMAAKTRLIGLSSPKGRGPDFVTPAKMHRDPWSTHFFPVQRSSPHLELQFLCLIRC